MTRTLGRGALIALLLPLALQAQQPAAAEFEVKAAYLYNFARFISWPPTRAASTDAFAICVIGADPFGPTLDATLSGVSLRGARVVSRRIAAPQDAAACRILFISTSEERSVQAIFNALGTADVLTVSDMPQFIQRGGMVQFVSEGRRVRFEVGLGPARAAGLMFSSELLRVARAVRAANTPSGQP